MAPSQATILVRIKSQLKLAIARLRMVQRRDEAVSKSQQRAMAQLLEAGKISSAHIRVENIIRTDIMNELYEILELYCELLLARAGLLEGPQCDPGLEEAVRSIIYAAPKIEIKELQSVRLLFGEKYGKDFVASSAENTDGKVSAKVVRKLQVTPPSQELVEGYLEEIARAYGVEWPRRRETANVAESMESMESLESLENLESSDSPARPRPKAGGDGDVKLDGDDDDDDDDDDDGDLIRTMPRGTPGKKANPVEVTPPRRTTENLHPKLTLNSEELKPDSGGNIRVGTRPLPGARRNKAGVVVKGGAPDPDSLEELEKRFAALKRR